MDQYKAEAEELNTKCCKIERLVLMIQFYSTRTEHKHNPRNLMDLNEFLELVNCEYKRWKKIFASPKDNGLKRLYFKLYIKGEKPFPKCRMQCIFLLVGDSEVNRPAYTRRVVSD